MSLGWEDHGDKRWSDSLSIHHTLGRDETMHFVRPGRTWSLVTENAVPRGQNDVTAKDYWETKYVGTVITKLQCPADNSN